MLNIVRFVFNNFDENTYLVSDKATGEAAIIDPGMLFDEERKALDKAIADSGIKITQIILTHAHLDHCFGANYVRNAYSVPLKIHADDIPLLKLIPDQGRRFGLGKLIKEPVEYDVELHAGDVIAIGESKLEVIHLPGHSPGGIVLYDKDDDVAFVGDSIFAGSIGRTDLEGGNHSTLINSLHNKILTLPDQTILLSGHGEPTTVARERASNPFLA